MGNNPHIVLKGIGLASFPFFELPFARWFAWRKQMKEMKAEAAHV